jgi:rubrerythrin
MSERFRNDLYYIERLGGAPMAIYPDGRVGKLSDKKIEVEETSASRRPDRRRTVKKTKKVLAQTALFDSASDYLAAYNKKLAKTARTYQNYGEGSSYSIDDMPDEVIAEFEKWKESLDTPGIDDVREAACVLMATSETAQEATITCPDCKGGKSEPQYACRSCGYAGAYYKYPLVRLKKEGEDSYRDVPFDVARLVVSDPDAFTFEVRTRFDWEGKMGAEQVAILHPNKISGAYMGENENDFHIEEADALNTEIEFEIAAWREKGFRKEQPMKLTPKEPHALIEAMQHHASTRVVREQTDMPGYQEMYVEFMKKIQKLGKGAMVVVFRGRYIGMGESEVEMFVSEKPDDPLAFREVWSSSEVKWLIKDVMGVIDKVEKASDLHPYLYNQLMKELKTARESQ